ncbi:MAG TPA: AMP-binding protein [Chloroflexota bacterium]|nr:AMP-binding protein [Chloroflexota bacterium]
MPRQPASIVEAFLSNCDRASHQPCILFDGETYSYVGLRDAAATWASALRSWGLRPGDRVALFLENSPTFVAAYLGIYLTGGIVVLVNTQYRQVELRHILNDAGVRLCVTDPPRQDELARVVSDLSTLEAVVQVGERRNADTGDAGPSSVESGARVAEYAAEAFLTRGANGPLVLPPGDAVALIGYTSGTTGRSKGAMLTHANLAANSAAVTRAWRWTADDRLLLTLPLFHAHGLGVGMHGTLLAGSAVDLRRRFDATEVYATLSRGSATMFFGVPTMYTRLLAEARQHERHPAPIRLYVSGSAPLSAQTFAEFERRFGQRILERYGMTETMMNLTNPFDGERRPGTVGQPFPGQEARIVDTRTRRPIPDDRPGEIQVRGPHVFKGYWQRPDATEAAFDAEGWFNTGDLGWRSADGYVTISGRARELIITGGYNVYPREVEEVLLMHPGVAEAAVLGLPDADLGETVVAAVVRRSPDDAPSADDLVAFCRDQLASFKKPRQVVFVDALPRNALGKIQKHILRDQLEGGSRPQSTW